MVIPTAPNPPTAELQLLGPLDLRGPDGQELLSIVVQPKRLALLAYLALAEPRGYHRRDHLLALFWPELDAAHARNALSKALHVLRRAGGEGMIVVRGDGEVSVSGSLRVDVWEFEQALEERRLPAALKIYRGDLLPGFFVRDASPELDSWLDEGRQRLKTMALRASLSLADEASTTGGPVPALEWYRRARQLAPHDEGVAARLMRQLFASGDRAGALTLFVEFSRRLQEDLDLEPSTDLTTLVSEIRASPAPAPATGSNADSKLPPGKSAGAPLPAPAANSEPRPVDASAALPRPSLSSFWRQPFGRWLLPASAVAVSFLLLLLALPRQPHPSPSGWTSPRQLTFSGSALRPSISGDGQFIAFTASEGDSTRVIIQDVAGGEQDTVSIVFNIVYTLEWSPNGSELLVGGVSRRNGSVVLLIPRLGGSARSLGVLSQKLTGIPYAYWLPDGTLSAHTPSSRQILVVDPSTGQTEGIPVEGDYRWLLDGRWSPDGRYFAVVASSSGGVGASLLAVGRRGGTTVLHRDTTGLGAPHWSSTGDSLLFARGAGSIWRIPVERNGMPGGSPAASDRDLQIAPYRFRGFTSLSVTPDGRWLTYAAGQSHSNVWVIDAAQAGTPPRLTALTTGTALRWSPVVSPNGEWVAYSQGMETGADLYRVRIAGGASVRITHGARAHPRGQIAWSPDGARLAFISARSGVPRIWLAELDGSLRPLERTVPSAAQAQLTWAPGREIAHHTPAHDNIRFVDPVDGDERALVAEETPGWFFSPRYSPDGTALAVAWNPAPEGRVGVWVFPWDGSPPVEVLDEWVWPLGWSPDGRYIFAQESSGPTIIRIDTRRPLSAEPVLNLSESFPFFSWANCAHVGAASFVCTIAQNTSDVWIQERLAD